MFIFIFITILQEWPEDKIGKCKTVYRYKRYSCLITKVKHLCWNHTCECYIRNHCARHAKAALGYKPHYGTYMAFWRYCRNARAPISLLSQTSLRSMLLVARHLLRCFRCHCLRFDIIFINRLVKGRKKDSNDFPPFY